VAEVAAPCAGLAAGRIGRPLRMAVVGVSATPTCGVRAHAVLLAQALEREGVSCSVHWLQRNGESLSAARSEVRAWTRQLAIELDRDAPDAVLLHYSVFAYSYRGVPLFVHPVLSALRRSRAPLIAVLHELAYPWGRGGWHGRAWALTQRAALIEVMRACAAALVTADFRAEWLASRRWLARRSVAVAPVFSNLPPPDPGLLPARRGDPGLHLKRRSQVIGLFGYAYEGSAIFLVLDAIGLLRDRGVDAQLRLLGAPGRGTPAAEAWQAAARGRDLGHALSCSDTLSPQDLSDALAACDALLFADATGPSSRKGTLAASLASGRPVIAIDGPRRWPELVRSDAAIVVAPQVDSLAQALGAVLADEGLREALGERGRAFAERSMGVARTVRAVTELLGKSSAVQFRTLPY
jgi:glycosyltransferase involved in cell wall biosynthesis